MDIKNILIDKISPSPINPRKSFDGAACPDEKSGDVININDAYKIVIIWRLLDRKNGCHFPCRQTITDFRPRAKIVMGKAAAVVHNKL